MKILLTRSRASDNRMRMSRRIFYKHYFSIRLIKGVNTKHIKDDEHFFLTDQLMFEYPSTMDVARE